MFEAMHHLPSMLLADVWSFCSTALSVLVASVTNPVWLSPRPSRSIRVGDGAEALFVTTRHDG